MDFERLAQILPKPSMTWTITDTQKWVDFVGLHMLAGKFQELGIDGSCLHSLNEQDFRQELGVSSNIMMKKIMRWINAGFKQFDDYLSVNRLGMTLKPNSARKPKMPTEVLGSSRKMQELPEVYQPEIKRQATHSDSRSKNQDNQLIIKQCEVVQANFFSFKNSGGMIGRNSCNQIYIPDEFVSRNHAQILFEEEEYYLRDCGSSSGTFIRITEKKQVENGVILEIGSNQFQVSMSDKHLVALKVVDGPNMDFCFLLPKKDKITIGRKPHNEIHFPDDHHLSNIHGTFFSINGCWYVEDLGSTNGTWIRLSEEGTKSAKWKLEDKMQFKISSNLTYECRRNTENRKTEKDRSEKCIFCKEADRNAIILPCKHNTCCFDCVGKQQLQFCQCCGASIADVIKIFKV